MPNQTSIPGRHTLVREQFVPLPLDRVFPFFENPENLGRITPPAMGFTLITPRPIVMRQGLEIQYKIRIGGIWLRWMSRITEHTPPNGFVDVQIWGPYRYWHHRHSFIEKEGGTLVRDEVNYSVGWGPFGPVIHWLVVHRQLQAIFDYREQVISQLLREDRSKD